MADSHIEGNDAEVVLEVEDGTRASQQFGADRFGVARADAIYRADAFEDARHAEHVYNTDGRADAPGGPELLHTNRVARTEPNTPELPGEISPNIYFFQCLCIC